MPARRLTKIAAIGTAGLLILVALMLATPFLFRMTGQEGRITLAAKTPYTEGKYYAFANPWSVGDASILGIWSRTSESMWIDHAKFPDHTRINWAWPPFAPRSGVGVWGYHHIGYGYYDGGAPEENVVPRQVKAIQALSADLAWDGDFTFGEATVLTEFYLRSNPKDDKSKTLEIGWLLHLSPNIRKFIAQSKYVGDYTDDRGRRWKARLFDTYLTFSPYDEVDVGSGTINMLHALRWLRAKGRISGDEWLTGLAFGAEPIKGFGNVEIKHWRVVFR